MGPAADLKAGFGWLGPCQAPHISLLFLTFLFQREGNEYGVGDKHGL